MNRNSLAIWFVLALVAGCSPDKGDAGRSGADGEDGAPGADGEDGAPGADGEDGLSCWDLNGDGEPNPEEDTNGDGVVDVADCSFLTADDPDDTDDTGTGWTSDRREFDFIETSSSTTCGLDIDGTLHCWGAGLSGLADVPEGEFTQLSMGTHHGCALDSAGDVTCWGANSHGQSSPLDGPFVAVESGQYSSCGIREGGGVECWGDTDYPEAYIPESETFSEIAMAGYSGCGIKTDGTVTCWGTETALISEAPEGTFSNIDNYNGRACAVRTDNVGRCWGYFDGIHTDVRDYALASNHTCIVHTDGRVACWNPTSVDYHSITADAPEERFTQLDADSAYVCGVRVDGTADCWGHDYYGEASPP